jgi:hypothetical protein
MSMTFNIDDIISRLVEYQEEHGDIEISLSDDYYETSILLELLADAMQELEISEIIDNPTIKPCAESHNYENNIIPFKKLN